MAGQRTVGCAWGSESKPEFFYSEEQRLALELDGWQHHRSHASFIADRSRANQLILAGWMVLRFTAQSLDALVPETRRALRERQG